MVNFEQVNVGWVVCLSGKNKRNKIDKKGNIKSFVVILKGK